MITVIVPAHNESRVIGRLLRQLIPDAQPGELDVIVVPNGCTDDTAAVAAAFGPPVRVVSIDTASKREALLAGDRAARSFPRLYVDADVETGIEDIRAIASALQQRPQILAAAPDRVLGLDGSPLLVRWYYDVWARLPHVQEGLFGRGVIAVSEAGHVRIASLPPVLADDLAASLSFAPGERIIVSGARAVVHVPRTMRDLVRRRVRAAEGVAQIERSEEAPESTARTQPSELLDIARNDPRMAPRVALFLAVAVIARLRARRTVTRGDYSTWLRDESSRASESR